MSQKLSACCEAEIIRVDGEMICSDCGEPWNARPEKKPINWPPKDDNRQLKDNTKQQ